MPTILAVDDSASMRQMVALTLTSAGYAVSSAVDGRDALAQAKKQSFQLVLTDLHMPNMNGLELIRELRQHPSYKFTPILMLTTEAAADRKTEGKSAGATGWIVKPFSPEQLLATIKRVLPA